MNSIKIKVLFFLLLSSTFCIQIEAQRSIQGTIIDAQSFEPLIGANVIVLGTSTGTVSDFNGSYSLTVPEGKDLLEVSYTGYATQQIRVRANDIININLSSGEFLDEVVVIGYGTVTKEDATGSLQTVNAEDFNKGAITSAQELLSGKIAGVQITTGGDPGGGSRIRIRGGSSLSASNDPLIVIDGVPIDNGGISGMRNPLNTIHPNDIESFTVLKDASATAIYGSRASNGVILITTKKGSVKDKMKLTYNGNFSVANIAQMNPVYDANEYRALIEEQYDESHPARSLLGSANTNWQEEIFQTGTATDHNVSVSGALKELPYRVSLGYTNENGILKTGNFNRLTGAVSFTPQFFDNHLQFNINLKGMKIDNTFANWGAIGSALSFDPTQAVRDDNSAYAGFFTWTQPDGNPITIAPSNPVALLELTDNQSDVYRYITSAQIDYRFHFLPKLRANLNVAYDYSNGEGASNSPENASFAFINGGSKSDYNQQKKNELLDFYLNYGTEFKANKLDLMAGYSWQHFWFQNFSQSSNLAETIIFNEPNTDRREYYLVSLFGRANLTLKDRILLTATLRRDGTSRFSPENRWGLFPAFAAAVKLVKEEDRINHSILSSMKLRLGYGITGQQDIGNDFYAYQARYLAGQSNAQYQFGDQFVNTLRPQGYDANIKWEETTTYNAGVDYGLFDERVYGSLDYYQRFTKDLLNFVPVPAGTNLTNFLNTNVGDLENKGIEFSMNFVPIRKKESTLEIGFNLAANRNKITRLTASDDPDYQGVETGGIGFNNIQIHSVGHPLNSFFVFEQVYDDNGVPIEGLYVDRNNDGVITADDKYRYQKPAPDMIYGFSGSYNIKNFDLSFGARANIGGFVYNNNWSGRGFYDGLYHSTNYLNNMDPILQQNDFNSIQIFTDHFVKNASFFRVDHITAGYNLSEISKAISNLRLYVTAQNPILITKYDGIDPEIASGIDNTIYPRSNTFLLGLSAEF